MFCMRQYLVLLTVLFALISSACSEVRVSRNVPVEKKISSYEECVAAGNPVLRSYPGKCIAGDKTFVQPMPRGTLQAL